MELIGDANVVDIEKLESELVEVEDERDELSRENREEIIEEYKKFKDENKGE